MLSLRDATTGSSLSIRSSPRSSAAKKLGSSPGGVSRRDLPDISIEAVNPLCFLGAAMPESDQPNSTPPTYSSKTLFEAPPYDPAKERKRKIKITVIVV